MAPTFCNRCGDAFEERPGCDPREELAELDALLERLTLKRYNLKRKINRFHSPIVRQLPPDVMSNIFEFCLPDITDHQFQLFSSPAEMKKKYGNLFHPYRLEPFAFIGETLLGQPPASGLQCWFVIQAIIIRI